MHMSEEKVTQNNTGATPATPTEGDTKSAPANNAPASATQANGARTPQKREFKKNRRNNNRRRERPRSEFEQKILDIRRVTRVSSGGRRFSFSVAIVIGDKKGRVGVGTGKAGDTTLAIDKAVKNAKRNLFIIPRTMNNSIPHDTKAKYCSGRVMLMPAQGRGLIAGSAVRDLLELGGVTDVNAKIVSGTKNKLNIAQATIAALKLLKTPVKSEKKETVTAKAK